MDEFGVEVLRDHLQENLKVVVVGTSVATASAARGRYYAGKGNKAYELMHAAGFTGKRVLSPEEDHRLPSFGIGLTDLVKGRASSSDGALNGLDYDIGGFVAKIERYRPIAVAFNGREAARRVAHALGHEPRGLGPALWKVADSHVYVLPEVVPVFKTVR